MPAALSESVLNFGITAKGPPRVCGSLVAAAKADEHEFNFLFENRVNY